MTTNRYRLVSGCYMLYGCLGFYRGLQKDDYEYQEKVKKKGPDYMQNHPRMYLKAGLYGIIGLCLYIAPIMMLFTFQKELYRLEIDSRGLKRKPDYYNFITW